MTKIEPGASPPFAEVEAEIKRDLAGSSATERGQHAARQDRGRARRPDCGSTRSAKKLSLPVRVIDAVDRSGRGPDGKPIANLPQGVDVLSPALLLRCRRRERPAADCPAPASSGSTSLGITPSRDRTLDEVKDRSRHAGATTRSSRRLEPRRPRSLDKLKSGAKLADIAAADKLTVETASGLKRQARRRGLRRKTLAEVFRAAKATVAAPRARTRPTASSSASPTSWCRRSIRRGRSQAGGEMVRAPWRQCLGEYIAGCRPISAYHQPGRPQPGRGCGSPSN